MAPINMWFRINSEGRKKKPETHRKTGKTRTSSWRSNQLSKARKRVDFMKTWLKGRRYSNKYYIEWAFAWLITQIERIYSSICRSRYNVFTTNNTLIVLYISIHVLHTLSFISCCWYRRGVRITSTTYRVSHWIFFGESMTFFMTFFT